MNYCEIKTCDIANGEGVRTSLFVSGCTNHCEECFQPQTWDFGYGKPFTREVEDQIIRSLQPDYINGLTLLGGEPFEPAHQRALWQDGSYPRCEATDEMLSLIDVLVDGRYVKALKDISLRFRGSSNQRIIDVAQSLAKHEVILWEGKNP